MRSGLIGAIGSRLAHPVHRFEERLLPLRPFERLQLPSPPSLTVICDDGAVNDTDIVEVLDGLGVKGVFAISPALVGRTGFLGFDQIRAMHLAGHEIAFHGTTNDGFTAFADASALETSMRRGLAQMKDEGLSVPRTLVYPYGLNNRWVRAAVSTHFDCAFTTWHGLNDGVTNRFAIRRVAFGAYSGKLPATEEWYRQIIDEAVRGSCWPALMLHPGAEGHTRAHTGLLQRLLNSALERGLAIHTAAAHLGASGQGQSAPSAAYG